MRLKYTHGYGLCMSPVNRHTEEGLPVLIIKDIPPTHPEAIPLTQPRIYYGRRTTGYVFVNTGTDEFDFPRGDRNAYNRYDGEGGAPIGSAFRQFVYYTEFGDVDILFSDDIQEGSRVLYRRRIDERVKRVAPYLLLDDDPYSVIHEGRIVWIQDAYTRTRRFPYSDPSGGARLNYIRNSVKAVVDAYDGSVTLYIADEDDPLIQVYSKIFPGVYKPMSEMPQGLRRHVRYPVDLFNIQAGKYRAFHMQDPEVFYNQEDLWEVPLELYRGQKRAVESYYIIMRLPGSDEAEFLLMLPFTPRNKQNMISWLAARCDGEHYGDLVAYRFPKQKLIYGPNQVEARIDQEPEISRRLSLWSQRGSEVIRGNLLVIPVAGGILYVEPLFIEAEAAAVPQMKRVITAFGKRVAMRATLEESLKALFGEAEAVPPAEPVPEPAAPEPAAPEAPTAQTAAELIGGALSHYRSAQQALQEGDWARYGSEMEQMKEQLDRLRQELPAPAEAQ
jgi:hypothetical protein